MRRRDVLGLVAAVAPWSGAWAHPMPNSTALVEVRPGSVRLTVSVPLSELVAALGPTTTEAELKAQLEGCGIL